MKDRLLGYVHAKLIVARLGMQECLWRMQPFGSDALHPWLMAGARSEAGTSTGSISLSPLTGRAEMDRTAVCVTSGA